MAASSRPIVKDLVDELENALLPAMRHEDIANETICVQHQGPTHAPMPLRDWHDDLCIYGVNGWPDTVVFRVELIQTFHRLELLGVQVVADHCPEVD
eukprot:CAMPEP_0115453070 /NCGR_PEP_ID=MMETSP0271-20121206/42922_1 /TAXON_ID=71861 /ORGANISM="Scrippsiella trochoidea, Strain CCMP3099" /LENGTH=96 /DNA_ID=CAMNT_0002879421 /DNA_START=1108 /DNA_END=1398 /DNA_ORIENTATION=+